MKSLAKKTEEPLGPTVVYFGVLLEDGKARGV